MANIKYFNGTDEILSILPMGNKEFVVKFPGAKGRRWDGYSMMVGHTTDNRLLPVERAITYKSNPSRHECNSKCMSGKVNGSCECRCGGKNHGVGGLLGKPLASLVAA